MVKHQDGGTLNGKIRCDACPVMCYISEGRSGACDRYANVDGDLIRVDPLTILQQVEADIYKVVPFLALDQDGAWDGDLVLSNRNFLTAVGAGTTYPDYKPAPFIVSQQEDGVDFVTVVTEGIFSYCGAKVKIDTDRFIGPESAAVRVEGEQIGHVTTGEYGSQMMSLGGVHHLTGGSKKEGRVTCDALLRLCNGQAVEMVVDGGASLVVQAGEAPIINDIEEKRMRVGCGSASIGMFAKQWAPLVDEVVVVDDHITGVLSEHQAGRLLNVPQTGIKIRGRKSTPGRYFQVAGPGSGWGGTNISDPLTILSPFDPKIAWPGLRLLMVSTTGEQSGYYVLDDQLRPVLQTQLPAEIAETIALVEDNCELAVSSVLFMGGAGGSLRAGVTRNPVQLTRSVRQSITHVTCGGVPAYLWPGGGITVMVDVKDMPSNSFGFVPTPALVAPIEFTMRLKDYQELGGHMEAIVPIEEAIALAERKVKQPENTSWPMHRTHYKWGRE